MRWIIQNNPIDYNFALAEMEQTVHLIRAGQQDETIWFLEHPSLYTAGTLSKAEHLLNPQFPVFQTGRGGQYTYHGPGQRVAYVMLDLKKRQNVPDIKKYVWQLEEWIIKTLSAFDVMGERRDGRVGIWVSQNGTEKKIAAVGVRIRNWVTYHGISININPDLNHYNEIIPCGLKEYGVTKLHDINSNITMSLFDSELKLNFGRVF